MDRIPLESGETITKSYRLSPVALVAPILVSAALAAGAGIAVVVAIHASVALYPAYMGAALLLVFISGVTLLAGWLTYRRSLLVVTSLHIYRLLQRSLFSQNLESVTLAQVTNAQGDRSGIVKTILNYGTVSIEVTGGTQQFLSFSPVGAPEYVAITINQAHESFVLAHPGQSL